MFRPDRPLLLEQMLLASPNNTDVTQKASVCKRGHQQFIVQFYDETPSMKLSMREATEVLQRPLAAPLHDLFSMLTEVD